MAPPERLANSIGAIFEQANKCLSVPDSTASKMLSCVTVSSGLGISLGLVACGEGNFSGKSQLSIGAIGLDFEICSGSSSKQQKRYLLWITQSINQPLPAPTSRCHQNNL